MNAVIASKQVQLAGLCARYGVIRLEVFGSAAHRIGDLPPHSDIDFLVTFSRERRNDLLAFEDFKAEAERLFGRKIDLVEREAVEGSRNVLRSTAILAEAELVHG